MLRVQIYIPVLFGPMNRHFVHLCLPMEVSTSLACHKPCVPARGNRLGNPEKRPIGTSRCVSEDLFQFELIPDIGEPKILSVGTSSGKLCTGFITDSGMMCRVLSLQSPSLCRTCWLHCVALVNVVRLNSLWIKNNPQQNGTLEVEGRSALMFFFKNQSYHWQRNEVCCSHGRVWHLRRRWTVKCVLNRTAIRSILQFEQIF